MSVETLLLFIVIALALMALPAWPYSKSWGYMPTGILTVFLVVFLVWAIAAGRPIFRSTAGQDFRSVNQDLSDYIRRAVR